MQIHFGRGCRVGVIPFLTDQKCLIVTSAGGRERLKNDPLLHIAVAQINDPMWVSTIQPNPDLGALQAYIDKFAPRNVESVVAFGGGSAIDSAKVFALALAPKNRDKTLEFLLTETPELPEGSSLPLYVIPTTAGTGSEVTPFATVWDHSNARKKSFFGPTIFPNRAWIDPELTDELPHRLTATTGLDAINQAGESIWNRRMTPISEALAQRSLVLGLTALPRIVVEPRDTASRDAMAEASLLAGLAISLTRTSLCHSISYPITARFQVPHGFACAFTMPAVLRFCAENDDGRLQRLADAVVPNESTLERLIEKFEMLNRELGVGKLVRSMVKKIDYLYEFKSEMLTPGRSDNLLMELGDEKMDLILKRSWLQI